MRSSPGPKTGCSVSPVPLAVRVLYGCDPHPVRRPGAACSTVTATREPVSLRSSPGPKTGCSDVDPDPGADTTGVAILTRSEDRVQRCRPRAGCGHHGCCDPHPVRRPGAAPDAYASARSWNVLRSSPGPKTGCSRRGLQGDRPERGVAILTRSEDRVQHPELQRWVREQEMLRSSPGPKTGCSTFSTGFSNREMTVAILTRSEDRVQPPPRGSSDRPPSSLRSSPGPKTGCSLDDALAGRPPGGLRSSPGPKTGCSLQFCRCTGRTRHVAILTRSEDRVQPSNSTRT